MNNHQAAWAALLGNPVGLIGSALVETYSTLTDMFVGHHGLMLALLLPAGALVVARRWGSCPGLMGVLVTTFSIRIYFYPSSLLDGAVLKPATMSQP